MSSLLLSDAAQALEVLAQGQEPDPAGILGGTVALDAVQLTSAWQTCSDTRALVFAAQVMLYKAMTGKLNLDAIDKAGASDLARRVRELAASVSAANS